MDFETTIILKNSQILQEQIWAMLWENGVRMKFFAIRDESAQIQKDLAYNVLQNGTER